MGDYSDEGKTDTCEPYPLAPCSHHVAPTKYPKCPSQEYHTPSCVHSCPNKGYPTGWEADKKKAASSYGFRSVKEIQADMVKYGTVTAAFTVYADFVQYKSGVYVHKTGQGLVATLFGSSAGARRTALLTGWWLILGTRPGETMVTSRFSAD